jgi:PAS domain S-box-containing protein
MESRLVKRASRSPLATYGVAVAAPILALLVRLPFKSVLGEKVPYITFFLATAVSATFGGFRPGLVATALGALLALRWILPPADTFTFNGIADASGFMLFVGIGSFISYLAGRLIESRKHEKALRLLFQQTLVSIGDALISIDDEQRVRLMNPVAERLTGWKEGEAKGRSISEVFHLVREGTDVPAEIPIESILRGGTVAGLTHHTELVTRTGERISIDDSGAPIRDEAGRIAGAVLISRDIRDESRTGARSC